MAGNRKVFQQTEAVSPLLAGCWIDEKEFVVDATYPPDITQVDFGVNTTARRRFDFAPFYGRGCDEITLACQRAIEQILRAKNRSPATVSGYCRGLNCFLDFCAVWAAASKRSLALQDIKPSLIEEYRHYLAGLSSLGYTSQKTLYSQIHYVLSILGERCLLPPASELFPPNAYPHSDRHIKGESPLSEPERERLVGALKTDLVAIFKGRFQGLISESLAICLIAICLRAGRNTTPMLELSRDALSDHPFVANLRLLTTFKRRGSATHLTPLQWRREIDTASVVNMDAVAIYEKVKTLTATVADVAPAELEDRLWVYRSESYGDSDRITALSVSSLNRLLKQFAERHQLKSDDGKLLFVNPSRLRKTFLNRLWRLSGGDPFTVARLGGHSIQVLNSNYLEPTPEQERNHKFLGDALVFEWRGKDDNAQSAKAVVPIRADSTPIGRCRDPYEGDLAPKNGKACIDFLSCFHCRSYVITDEEKDLHRLYSFYWFMVRERERIGKNRWAKVYGWIVRMIDEQVTAGFDRDWVAAIRRKAHDIPHPFWRDPRILEASRGT